MDLRKDKEERAPKKISKQEQFKFDNYSRRIGGGGKREWHEWKVFMDETADKLDKVSSVEYRLHETFPNPIRIIKDRNSRFALSSAGWGNFTIFITVYLDDGTEIPTKYFLELRKSWPPEESTMSDAENLGT